MYAAGVQTDNKLTHRLWIRRLAGVSESHEVVHVQHLPGDPAYSVVPDSPVYRVKRNADLNGGRRFTLLEVVEVGVESAGVGIYG
ncbi:hypothetical protein D3C76_1434090 [compost metagenome]